jgi:hypothetical protein
MTLRNTTRRITVHQLSAARYAEKSVASQFENQRCRKSTNTFTVPNGMMTMKNAATAQFVEMTCNPHSDRTSPSRRMRTVKCHCDLLRLIGFVMPAISSPLV